MTVLSARSAHLAGGAHACLLFHGLASSPLEVRFVGKLLQRAGFCVHMPVISGYSQGERASRWQDWVSQALELVEDLRIRHASVSVAGLSVGATLALAVAQRCHDVQAAALWSVTLRYDGWSIPWYRPIFEPCYALGIGRRYAYRERSPFGLKNERWRARIAEAMRTHQSSAAGPALIPSAFLYQASMLGRHVARQLEKVTCDTLVIHAADDETASPRNADEVLAGIRSAHKRRIMLGDSYHLITLDNERELVARETIRFFQQSVRRSHPGQAIPLVSSARALMRLQRRRALERHP